MIEKVEEILNKNEMKFTKENGALTLDYPFYLGLTDRNIKLFVYEKEEKLYISDNGLFNSVYENCLNENDTLKIFFNNNKINLENNVLVRETKVSSCYFDLSDFMMCLAHAEFSLNGEYNED